MDRSFRQFAQRVASVAGSVMEDDSAIEIGEARARPDAGRCASASDGCWACGSPAVKGYRFDIRTTESGSVLMTFMLCPACFGAVDRALAQRCPA